MSRPCRSPHLCPPCSTRGRGQLTSYGGSPSGSPNVLSLGMLSCLLRNTVWKAAWRQSNPISKRPAEMNPWGFKKKFPLLCLPLAGTKSCWGVGCAVYLVGSRVQMGWRGASVHQTQVWMYLLPMAYIEVKRKGVACLNKVRAWREGILVPELVTGPSRQPCTPCITRREGRDWTSDFPSGLDNPGSGHLVASWDSGRGHPNLFLNLSCFL